MAIIDAILMKLTCIYQYKFHEISFNHYLNTLKDLINAKIEIRNIY